MRDVKNWQNQSKIFELENEIEKPKNENNLPDKKNKHLQPTKECMILPKHADFKVDEVKKEIKNIKDIKVAMISDEFTYQSFKHEFDAIPVTPENWLKKFKIEKPDLFLCESAWRGYDDEGSVDPWREKIYLNYREKIDNRADLLNILEYCMKNSIPTVFWNKEDPPHYRAANYSFADTAREFDYIFTSSEKCIKYYKRDYDHPNVHTLMFAGQPKLFNPINSSNKKYDQIVFAGTYYTNHPERIKIMDKIFDKIIEQWGDIYIFDRAYYRDWANYPERFLKYTHPPIEYEQTAKVYKQAYWGLNFNTVTDSETMFARRIFELALSYTNILTNYSKGVDKIFGNNVFVFDEMEELPDFNNPYTEMRLNNLYEVLENHTCKHRWMEILDTIGFEYELDKNDVSLIFKLSDATDLDDIISKFESINYENKILKILIDDKDINNDFEDRYPQISKVYTNMNQIKNDIETEFWMICDLGIDENFIRYAILHYQYLNKLVSIKPGNSKFKLTIEDSIENKLINKRNLSFIDNPTEILTYYINFKTNNKSTASSSISQNIDSHKITAKNNKKTINRITESEITITAEDINITSKEKKNYNVKLIDDKGKPIQLAGETIKITINDKEYNRKTNNNGIATLPINLNTGTHKITAKYNKKTINNIITITEPKITITAEDTTMSYKDGTTYNVQLIDDKGNPIHLAGETVKITINTIEYDRNTNTKGIATLPINLLPRNYEVTAKYNKKTINNIITVTKPKISIVADDINMTYKDGTTYNVQLIDKTGKPLHMAG
ncbi:glycosyltransferase, partial [Methanobrevibacter sp.]|uniref:glycosyltransferase family protein n=1 Tax=Methanobrevibacter sp. TaxID=66852 RepID=UPI003863889D